MIGLDQNPQKLVCSPALSTLWRHIRQYVSSFADPCCLLLLLTDLTSPFSRHSIPFFPDCRMWLADVYYSAGGKEEERVQNSWFAKGGGAKQLRNSYTRSTLANSSFPFETNIKGTQIVMNDTECNFWNSSEYSTFTLWNYLLGNIKSLQKLKKVPW